MQDAARWVRDAYGYMQVPEIIALEEVIANLPENSVCVNIGAGFGTSGLAFIQSPNVARLYTIDLFALESENDLGSLEFERKMFEKFGYGKYPRYMQINIDSTRAGKAWPYGLLDMVFLDGDHTFDHCYADIKAWLPNIKKGGIFAFHDYYEFSWMGVTQAIDELLLPKYEMISSAACFVAFRLEEKCK